MRTMRNPSLLKSLLAAGIAASTVSTAALAADDIFGDIPGKFILDMRLRGEAVDQDGKADDAEALTLRTRFGYESENYDGFQFLVEGENTVHLVDDFNDTINGLGNFPVVADPESTQLNRLHISYDGIENTKAILGRQRIILGDARYIGNVGFRQNEQTFDAVVLSHKPTEKISLTYAYINKAITLFGEKSPKAELDMDTHTLWAGLKTQVGTVTAFGILADFDDNAAASNATYGLNLAGSISDKEDGVSLSYKFEYARQKDYGNSPTSFELDMYRSEVGLKTGPFAAGLGVELLEGNGARGFTTPMATLHKYQGFADAFLSTPADGIRDLYAKASYKVKNPPLVKGLSFAVVYHDYETENGGHNLGSEIDAVATAKINDRTSLQLKYANFNGSSMGPADREKIWLALSWKL